MMTAVLLLDIPNVQTVERKEAALQPMATIVPYLLRPSEVLSSISNGITFQKQPDLVVLN